MLDFSIQADFSIISPRVLSSQYLLDLFQSLPRKQLEKEVAKSKSSGESQEELINRLLDQNPPIDLTCLEEEEEEVGAAELVETPEPGQ